MEHIYKQYVALATKWNKDVIFRARVTLISTYVAVSTLVVGITSHLLFKAILVNIADSIKDQIPNIADQARLFEHTEGILDRKSVV